MAENKKEMTHLTAEVANFDLGEVTVEELERRLELAVGTSPIANTESLADFTDFTDNSGSGGGSDTKTSGWS